MHPPRPGHRLLPICAGLALSVAAACAPDEPAVSDDPAAGVLARLDYADGASVELRERGEAIGLAGADGRNPLAGLGLADLTAAALFETLTGAPAPEVLDKGGPVASGEFECQENADFCGTNLHVDQTVKSGRRLSAVYGRVVITSGSMRLRVIHDRVGNDRVLLTRFHTGPYAYPVEAHAVPFDRRIRVVVDQTSDVTYAMTLNFHDGR